jgi:hypothetical protein
MTLLLRIGLGVTTGSNDGKVDGKVAALRPRKAKPYFVQWLLVDTNVKIFKT